MKIKKFFKIGSEVYSFHYKVNMGDTVAIFATREDDENSDDLPDLIEDPQASVSQELKISATTSPAKSSPEEVVEKLIELYDELLTQRIISESGSETFFTLLRSLDITQEAIRLCGGKNDALSDISLALMSLRDSCDHAPGDNCGFVDGKYVGCDYRKDKSDFDVQMERLALKESMKSAIQQNRTHERKGVIVDLIDHNIVTGPRCMELDLDHMTINPEQKSRKYQFIREYYLNLNLQESTLIDCTFCQAIHPGPHCYEGNCSETILRPSSYMKYHDTQTICNFCPRRHNRPVMQRDKTSLRCLYCSRSHEPPFCWSGTCTELDPKPYVCPAFHANKKCYAPECTFYGRDYKQFQASHETLFVCSGCGARHLTSEDKPAKKSVYCTFCSTRHAFPNCSEGSCRATTTVATTLTTSDGFALPVPLPRMVCYTCGKRHIPSDRYGMHYMREDKRQRKQVLGRCLTCDTTHSPPYCVVGMKCGDIFKNYPEAKTDSMKFICNVCGERHLEIPPIFVKIREKKHKCDACSTHHGPGTCVAAKTCEQALTSTYTANYPPVKLPLILCPSCNVRHIHLSALPFPAVQPGCNLPRSRRFGNNNNNEHGYSSGTFIPSQPLQATVNIGFSKKDRKKNKNKTITSSSTPSSTTSTITTTTSTSPTSISTTVAAVVHDNSGISAIVQGITQGVAEGIEEAKAKLEQDGAIKSKPVSNTTEDTDSDSSSGEETTTFLDPDDSEFIGEYFKNHQEKI